jgi:hypothetical protein
MIVSISKRKITREKKRLEDKVEGDEHRKEAAKLEEIKHNRLKAKKRAIRLVGETEYFGAYKLIKKYRIKIPREYLCLMAESFSRSSYEEDRRTAMKIYNDLGETNEASRISDSLGPSTEYRYISG